MPDIKIPRPIFFVCETKEELVLQQSKEPQKIGSIIRNILQDLKPKK